MIVRKTPEQVKQFLSENMHKLDLPELWSGDEPNSYGPWGKGKFFKDHNYFFNPQNDKDVVRFCYMCPCDLVQTAGNQTLPLLYQITNDRSPQILCERGAFPPTRKDIKIFNDGGIPPFSLESKHPIFTNFDIVGTTLAFPGFWPNLVKQFRDSGVPSRWQDRDKDAELYPIVFCGGQLFAQPGPIEPIVDVVVIGEGEDGVSGSDGDPVGFPTLLLDVIDWKRSEAWYTKEGRLELLHKWAREHHWCYVPRFYDYKYRNPRETLKHFISYSKVFDDIPNQPKRRWIKDMDATPCVTAPIINAHDPSMGLGEIEISRSCVGKCSFCAEIFRYAPYRERSVEYMVKVFDENIKNSGALQAFPTGFDFPCYSRKHELYVRLMQEVCSEVDTQSSRVDHFIGKDAEWAKMAGQAGMRQLAIGVEGNSERLRMIMSKGAPEEHILEAVRYAIENKFNKVKFFMIADWEWETEQDTQEIIELGKKIVEMKKSYGSSITVRFSWTPLLIESWTPLQWDRGVVEDKKLAGVYAQLKELGIGFTLGKKTERNYYYFMQGFHMADRLLAEVMIRVANKLDQVYCGAVDRQWVSEMNVEMEKEGLSWNHYFRRKDWDETFWWDLIDIDIPKAWFLEYAKRMHAMIDATDPVKLGKMPQYDELVSIGNQLKKDKGIRFQTNLLEKGMLVANCDVACSACMACEEKQSGKVDFYKNVMKPLYWDKNNKEDMVFKNVRINVLDDFSVSSKVFGKVEISDDKRFMPNGFWIASIRRAAYLANVPIAKRAIKLASNVHGYKPYVSGSEFIELGLRFDYPVKMISHAMNEFAPIGLKFIDSFKAIPRNVDLIARGVNYVGFFHYVLNNTEEEAINRMYKLAKSTVFEMSVKRDEYRKGITVVKMDVKEWLKDAWLVRSNHELAIAMLMRYGEVTPYNIVAAVFGMTLADSHGTPCRLVDLFIPFGDHVDFFSPVCESCGCNIPRNVLGEVYDKSYCPRCRDIVGGNLICSH